MKIKKYRLIVGFLTVFLLCSNLITISSSETIVKKIFFENDGSEKIDLVELFSKVNESVLEEYIVAIENFGPHPTGSQELEELRDYLFCKLNETGLNVKFIPWETEEFSGKNIEATLKGEKNESNVFVVCAHYDSVDVSPGADDDGSGVSVVLSAADILSDYVFNSTIKFVLFSGEEQGLLGSRDYVDKISEDNKNVVGVLNLDGVGYASTSEDGNKIRHYANPESSWMQYISQQISKEYKEYIGLEIRSLPHVTFSDHHSFVEKGYDASYFLEQILNPFYHTSEDKSENVNFSYLSKVCKLTMGCLVKMAEINPQTYEEDLEIRIKGQVLTKPGQFSVEILNDNYDLDTVNLSINIKIEPVFINKLFFESAYEDPYNWSVEKEIKENWVFKTINRAYPSGFVRLKVLIRGFNDDVHIYKYLETYGIVLFKYFTVFIPKNI
jgi:aminopeptidase YwaD